MRRDYSKMLPILGSVGVSSRPWRRRPVRLHGPRSWLPSRYSN